MDDKELTGRLKLAKPHALNVYEIGREGPTLVEISVKRDRWRKAVDALCNMEWTRIDCLSAQGAVVSVIAGEEPADDFPGTELLPTNADGQSKEERFLFVMINAQRLALENNQKMLQPLIDSYRDVVAMFAERLAALEKHYDQTMAVAYENALLQAKVDGDHDDANTQIVKELVGKLDLSNGKKQLNGESK